TPVTADFGAILRCVVTATNSVGNSSANSNSSLAVTQKPVNTLAPALSTTATKVGTPVSVTNGTWTGTPTITFAYQWLNNGAVIAGAISSSYTPIDTDFGDILSC